MRVDEATYVSAGIRLKYVIAYSSRGRKKENRMRTAIAAILVVTASAAMADDIDEIRQRRTLQHRFAAANRHQAAIGRPAQMRT